MQILLYFYILSMQKQKYTFQKSERIVRKKTIESIYQKGENMFVYPLKVRYLPVENNPENIQAKILISVPKKNFKKAVHRNRIKRLLRESYRLNKHILELLPDRQLNIHFHYVGRSILPFEQVQNSMVQILNQLLQEKDKK